MARNGLETFRMHSNDARFEQTLETINAEIEAADTERAVTFDAGKLDPETVARRYLDQMVASPAVPALGADTDAGLEFRSLGTETVGLTGATVVRFAQYFHRIPVYGSLVTVELDRDNEFLAISSSIGDPTEVDPVATVSPAQAIDVVRRDGVDEGTPVPPPRLYVYFDTQADPDRWRLVYIAKDVPRDVRAGSPVPELWDYVVDAHTSELVARMPRTQSMTWSPFEASASDEVGVARRVRLERDAEGNLRLNDTVRNVRTHDFAFQDAFLARRLLPGDFAINPPDPWLGAAVSAHANAVEVADFLLTVLHRNGLDNAGGPFVSSVNCTYRNLNPANREWKNAAWVGIQMIYGQRMVGGRLRSYAVARDVVAHEIMHGLTDKTARLDYQLESGAINESYSDIFGILISNADEPDVSRWNWEMGEDLDLTGVPLRDLSDPTKRGQPAHLDDMKKLGPGEEPARENDYGWLHVNSGIHNKAAYNLLTALGADGERVFTPAEVAGLFYLAVTQYLSRTSGFSDSRQGVRLGAQTLFRDESPARLEARLAAIDAAFDEVGIPA
jgi:bacillolysin/neutral peptidase B